MKLNIGDKIRCLRREKDITQEEFAEVLNVSCQSVSRWENNVCYPDIELLPVIADFFGVTISCLMGVDETTEKRNVELYLNQFKEAVSQGKIYDCIEIARSGIAEYPNNYALLNKLMYALFLAGDSDGNIPEWLENMRKYDAEITLLGERIMKYCPDQNIRLEAAGRLAFQHCEMGRKEIGRAIYETLPSRQNCREAQIWWALEDDEKLPFAYSRIREGYEALCHGIYMILSEKLLPDEKLVHVYEKQFALNDLIFDGNPPVSWGIAKRHIMLAVVFARLKKDDQMYEQLKAAAKAAREFDERADCHISTLLFGEFMQKKTDYETADSRTLCEIMLDKWLAAEEFNDFRDTPEFLKVVNSLH